MKKINKFYSYNLNGLPKGCLYCIRGEKLVLFATGLCPRRCYFCPISDKKYGLDIAFANEKKIGTIKDLIIEARNMDAKGAGITGGDPLAKLDKTIKYIKILKKTFSAKFHIHLYTSLNLVTLRTLERLYDAGLDEIRFHLDIDSNKLWQRLMLAKRFNWDVGVEIPLIPGKKIQIKRLVDFIQDKANFLNLNELETADNSLSKLGEMGYRTKSNLSYAIKGSLGLGLKIMDYIKNKKYSLIVHVCTAKLKDKIQLSNRIKREGDIVKMDFDYIDKDGLLTRGALYLPELTPSFGYREKLENINKNKILFKLMQFKNKIKDVMRLSHDEIYLDKKKPRILLSKKIVMKHKRYFLDIGLLPALVTEYPTSDQFEVEINFLK